MSTAADFTLPPIHTLDRLEFQMRYMMAFGSEHLAARPSGLAPELPAVETDDSVFLARVLKATPPGEADLRLSRLRQALQTFHGQALEAPGRLTDRLALGSPGAGNLASPGYRAWAWRRFLGRSGPPSAPGTASLRGLALCHQVLVWELARRSEAREAEVNAARGKKWRRPRWPAIRQEAEERLQQMTEAIDPRELTTGDMVSHYLAVLGLDFLLRSEIQRKVTFEWNSFLKHPGDPSRNAVLRLMAHNDLLLVDPDLKAKVEEARLRPAFEPAQLVGRVQDLLARVARFSAGLMDDRHGLSLRSPLLPGAAAREELASLASLTSPLRSEQEAAEFRKALLTELNECELRLILATVTPRPDLLDSVFQWGAAIFLLTDGVDCPLSDLCLHVMLLAYNLLALVTIKTDPARVTGRSAEDERALEDTREVLNWSLQQIAARTSALGDLFVLYLTLEGLRRALRAVLELDLKTGWTEVLDAEPVAEVVDPILNLACRTPITRMIVPEFEARLHQRKVPWTMLEEFLEDPSAELFRDFTAGRLVDQVLAAPFLLTSSSGRVLDRCLGSKSLGGALLAAEAVQLLVRRTFDAFETHAAATLTPRPSESAQRERDAAANQFKSWYHDPDDAVPRAVFGLLVDLWARKAALDRLDAAATDHRHRRLNQHWWSIIQQTTRGLRGRPWIASARRLLRTFWLNFAATAFRKLDEMPGALGVDDPGWDDLTRVGCWVAALTFRDVHAEQQASNRRKDLGDEPPADDGTPEGQYYADLAQARKDVQFLRKILDRHVLKNDRFVATLIVRRVLVREPDTQALAWNLVRVHEVAAWPM